jgi:hypothetical protein
MVSFSDLHAQNHKITELSNVFLYLIRERSMCDTECARNLFFEYVAKVREHVELVDASMEIKRIFAAYLKDWCNERKGELKIADHEAFVADTNQMFSLVLDRIERETEHLYPVVRRLDQAAA